MLYLSSIFVPEHFFFYLWHCFIGRKEFTEYFSFWIHSDYRCHCGWVQVKHLWCQNAKAQLCPSAPCAHKGLSGHSCPVTGIAAPGWEDDYWTFPVYALLSLHRFWVICRFFETVWKKCSSPTIFHPAAHSNLLIWFTLSSIYIHVVWVYL